jgi:hypothetical protein
MEFGGLSETNLVNKLVCFGTNKVTVFQGGKNGVIAQIMQKHAPFVSGVHCMAHCMSQPHFGLSVKVKPTLPKVGTWSPPGLPKIQKTI